jgi:F-type H+-transporting ATPase subunit delta
VLKGATARRYAGAVFELAVESKAVDSWRTDLRTLAEYFGNKRLQFILREPKIPVERKEQVVRDLLADKVQPQVLALALVLVERDLVDHAPAIYAEFEKRYNDYKGQAVAQITTAIPLDDDLRAQVIGELEQITGKRILLEERVDPAILGGAIARVGDTLIDGSIKRRFGLLRDQIIRGGRDVGTDIQNNNNPDNPDNPEQS